MTHRSNIYIYILSNILNRNRKHFVTRKHSSRMCAVRLPTIHDLVATNVCTGVCVGGWGGWVNNRTSGVGYRSHGDPPCKQTDTRENITFPQLRWQAVIIPHLMPWQCLIMDLELDTFNY